MEITFSALIKKIEIKALVSLDKAARLTIDLSGEDPEVIDGLNRLMRADREIKVTIKDNL